MAQPWTILVEGMDQIRRDIRSIDGKLGKTVGQANRKVGQFVVDRADRRRSALSGRFPSYRSRIVRIRASANQRRVEVTVRPAAAEYGTKVHTVFGRRVPAWEMRRRVWPAWSGNQWTEGSGAGGEVGFMVIPTIRKDGEQIVDEYLEAVASLVRSTIGE